MDDDKRLRAIGEAIEYGVMAVFVAGSMIAGIVAGVASLLG